MYAVEVDHRVEKDLRRAPSHIRRRFIEALAELAQDPIRPRVGFDVHPLTGEPGFRLRIGTWRIFFVVDHLERTVRVTQAKPRPNAYR